MRPQLAFKYCPRCGTPIALTDNAPRLECAGCGFTFYFNPTVAAAGVLHNPKGEIALLVRARDPKRGHFGLPGGFVDFGESAEAALAREVWEELGLRVTAPRFLLSAPNQYPYKDITYSVVDFFFSVEVDAFDDAILQAGEVSDLWVGRPSQTELDRMAFPSNRLAVERFLAIQKSVD